MEEYILYLCSQRHIPVSKLEKDLGFGNAYIAKSRKRGISFERVCMISEYLDVPIWNFSDIIRKQFDKELANAYEYIDFIEEQLEKSKEYISSMGNTDNACITDNACNTDNTGREEYVKG